MADKDPELPDREFGWWDMFVHEDDDARADGDWAHDERSVLLGFLSDRRLTLEMKCSGLDAKQMARQSVPPSDLSLLGIVQHLTSVENYWIQQVVLGLEGQRLYEDGDGNDLAFAVEADQEMVESAWANWREEVAKTTAAIGAITDMGQMAKAQAMPIREILVHLIREYAQHMGHADLLRERIDGRVGQ